MALPIRPEVAALPAYRAGRPPRPAADGRAYKLSSNENPFPTLPAVTEAIERAARDANRYPDAACTELTEAVADTFGFAPEQLCFGTGSVALIFQLLQAVCTPGDEVISAWRSFEAYPIAVQLTGARHVRVPLTADARHDLPAMAAAVTERTRAVLVCTPNNPTGPVVTTAELAAFCDEVPDDVVVLVDEAYLEFVRDPDAAQGAAFLDRPNVVILRTFAKAYGLAGLRVGYAATSPVLATALRATTLPFGVSAIAQAAAVAALGERETVLAQVERLVAERHRLRDGLVGLGYQPPASEANFVWLPLGEQTEAVAARLGDAGVSVRPFVGEGLRVSVGEPAATDLVLATLAG